MPSKNGTKDISSQTPENPTPEYVETLILKKQGDTADKSEEERDGSSG